MLLDWTTGLLTLRRVPSAVKSVAQPPSTETTAPRDDTTRNNSVGRGTSAIRRLEHRRFWKQPWSILNRGS